MNIHTYIVCKLRWTYNFPCSCSRSSQTCESLTFARVCTMSRVSGRTVTNSDNVGWRYIVFHSKPKKPWGTQYIYSQARIEAATGLFTSGCGSQASRQAVSRGQRAQRANKKPTRNQVRFVWLFAALIFRSIRSS